MPTFKSSYPDAPYPKIDLYLDGDYLSSTDWYPDTQTVIDRYLDTRNKYSVKVDPSRVTAKYR